MNWKSLLATLLLLTLVTGYGWIAIRGTHDTFNSADANGYMAQASLLANTGTTELLPREGEGRPIERTAEERLAYIGLHWLENERGEFWSRYPPGIGVLLAGPYLLFGPQMATWVQPLLAALTLFFLFLLCKPYLGPWGALLGATIYALHPMAFVHALNWGAHTPVAFCLVVGFYFLDSWARHPSLWKVVVAAFLLGSMPSFRYAEVIAGIAVGSFMLLHVIRARAHWTHLFVALFVASIPITLLLVRNYMAFGSPWDTGYALTGEQQAGSGFSLEHFDRKWYPVILSLMGNGLGLFFALGLAGLVGMCTRRDTRPIALLLGLSILLITGAYTAYYWGGTREMGLRFLLPTIPLYVLPALWLFQAMATTRAARAGVAFLVLAQMALFGHKLWVDGRNEVSRMERMAVAYEFLEERVPEGSVLIADRRLAETLQFYPQWQLLDGSLIGGSRRGWGRSSRSRRTPDRSNTPSGAPMRASPMQRGKARKLRARYDIQDSYERGRLIADDLYEIIQEGKPVYWIGSSRMVRGFEDKLISGDRFESLAKIELPKPPSKPNSSRSRRGFGNFNLANLFGPTAGQKLELFKLVLFDEKSETPTEKKPMETRSTEKDLAERKPEKKAGTSDARPVEAVMKKEK